MKDLRELKVDDLRDIGREYAITKLWKMNKSEIIAEILKRAKFYGHADKYFDSEAQDVPEQTSEASELIEEAKPDNYKTNEIEASECNQESSKPKLKQYAASVRDRKTKEIKDIFGEAASREEFYLSLKDDYRVRFIVKPEKLEEAYEKYRVGHARNLKLKQEKYTHDKEEAKKMNMNVVEYRKWLRESAKKGK